MKKFTHPICSSCAAFFLLLTVFAVTSHAMEFTKITLTDKFYAEGAFYGDFNNDGIMDVVYGPYWYEGPDFTVAHEFRPAQEYRPEDYSDNFVTFVDDFNGDGWPDILILPHPGGDLFWYENPKGEDGHWKKHFAAHQIGNESQVYVDMTGNGRRDLVYNMDGQIGFASWDPENPYEPWTFHVVAKDGKYQRYTHGIGAGDISDDGRMDLIESQGWWEQPEDLENGEWKWHPFHFADAAAHILVFDVDGDGLNDVVCSWHCHLYGYYWWKQVRDEDGNISFEKQEILPSQPTKEEGEFRISQMHAADTADFDGDGLTDFVTGKRFWAHGPGGDEEPNAPAVVYVFLSKRGEDGKAYFVPVKVDDDSGVGTQVSVVDLNGDGKSDIVSGNKKGCHVFIQK